MRLLALAVSATLLMAHPALSAPGAGAASRPARSFTAKDLVTLRSYTSLAWSNDGSRLAWVVGLADTSEDTNDQNIWMWDARTNQARQLTRSPKNDYSPTFSGTGDTLAFVAARGTGDDVKPAIWFLPLAGGEPWAFGSYPESVGEIAWSPDGSRIAFTLLDTLSKQVRDWRKKKWDSVVEDERLQYNHLWVVDVASGRKTRLTSGAFNCSAPRWSPDSRSIACLVNPTGKVDDGQLNDVAIVDAASGALRRLGGIPEGGPSWSPDSRLVTWVGGEKRDLFVQKLDVWVARADGGEKSVALTRSLDENGHGATWTTGADTLWFHAGFGTSSQVASAVVSCRCTRVGLARAGEAGAFTASSTGRVAWVQSSAGAPAEIFVADHPALPGRAVTSLNAAVANLALGRTRVVAWTSSDGVRVEGLLVRPAGAAPAARLKTLTVLHGGPYDTRYGIGFQPTAQLFAARGYQVFMPNFRSSGGYGTAFMVRERADWGGQDWRDVASGLDSLVARGLADPQKLGVIGGSYGGYLSAWAVTQTDRFDAAVVHAGPVDLPALWGQSDTHQYRAFEFEGRPWESFDKWRRSSPIAYVRNVKTPVLILNGEQDVRIPYPQAQMHYQALAALGVPTEFVHYPREGHQIREPRHRFDWYARQLAWFDRWVK
jgi:dipeptidyl aminopeptidase/acylaminoacyl peptidase